MLDHVEFAIEFQTNYVVNIIEILEFLQNLFSILGHVMQILAQQLRALQTRYDALSEKREHGPNRFATSNNVAEEEGFTIFGRRYPDGPPDFLYEFAPVVLIKLIKILIMSFEKVAGADESGPVF
jgi:hypothetical protein